MFDRSAKFVAVAASSIAVIGGAITLIVWLSGRASADDLRSLAARVTVQEQLRGDDHETLNRLDKKTDRLIGDVAVIKAAVQRR